MNHSHHHVAEKTLTLPLNIPGCTTPATPERGSPPKPPRTTITPEQAYRAVITGQLYVDLQISRLDPETTTVPLQSASDCWRLVGINEGGGIYRMWATIWPINIHYVDAPWYTNPQPINGADLALIADAYVATWGSVTNNGLYRRGSGSYTP